MAAVETPTPDCPNCGAPAGGAFCPACGQRQDVDPKSLRGWLGEVVEDTLSLSGSLPRTLGTLLIRPGKLTREWREGRRARWVPPFRLYLLCSVLFFTVQLIPVGDPAMRVDPNLSEETTINVGRIAGSQVETRSLAENAPTALFVLVPVFALVLKLFFVGTGLVLVEHAVHAFNLHAFTFLVLTLPWLGLRAYGEAAAVPMVVAVVWILASTIVSFSDAYGLRWWHGPVRAVPALFTYVLALGIGLAATSVWGADSPTRTRNDTNVLYWEMVDAEADGDTVKAREMRPTLIVRYGRLEAYALNNPDTRFHLADVLLRQGDAAEALTVAREAIVRDSTYLPALGLAARAARALGDTASEADYWRRLLEARETQNVSARYWGRHFPQVDAMITEARSMLGVPAR